jgi:hypothetical protein
MEPHYHFWLHHATTRVRLPLWLCDTTRLEDRRHDESELQHRLPGRSEPGGGIRRHRQRAGGWWSGQIEGATDELDAEVSYRYQDVHYSKQRITEFVPNKKVAWRVLDANVNFTEDPNEWTGTAVAFEVTPRGGQPEVRFTDVGLVPAFECFDKCSSAWSFYITNSLRRLITTGHGEPNTD